jgi:hypothetical protein
MRVLLTKPGAGPTSATILVLPQLGGSTFETLAGERVEFGYLAEVRSESLTEAVYAGASERDDDLTTAKELTDDVRWLHKALADYEPGSKIGLKIDPRGQGYVLDDSEATRINRVRGLKEGDEVAIGPALRPKIFFNAHGRASSIDGDIVKVTLDPGDRDRIERATGKIVNETMSFPLAGLERIA